MEVFSLDLLVIIMVGVGMIRCLNHFVHFAKHEDVEQMFVMVEKALIEDKMH